MTCTYNSDCVLFPQKTTLWVPSDQHQSEPSIFFHSIARTPLQFERDRHEVHSVKRGIVTESSPQRERRARKRKVLCGKTVSLQTHPLCWDCSEPTNNLL